jgi:hypothetical protein
VNGAVTVYNTSWGFSAAGAATFSSLVANGLTIAGTSRIYNRLHSSDGSPYNSADNFYGSLAGIDTFNYAAGAPYYGPFLSTFGGLGGNYPLQISAAYNTYGIAYRTRNGDAGSWNAWHNFICDDGSGNVAISGILGASQIGGSGAIVGIGMAANPSYSLVTAGSINVGGGLYVGGTPVITSTLGFNIKFYDGTMIQWGVVGSSGAGIALTFPVAFLPGTTPSLTWGGYTRNGIAAYVCNGSISNTGMVGGYVVYSIGNAGQYPFYWIAIGRWK